MGPTLSLSTGRPPLSRHAIKERWERELSERLRGKIVERKRLLEATKSLYEQIESLQQKSDDIELEMSAMKQMIDDGPPDGVQWSEIRNARMTVAIKRAVQLERQRENQD